MIYVDHARLRLGLMKMSHLMADTPEELREVAEELGLTKYIQYPNTPKEHLDVSETKRTEAIKLGAIEVDSRFLVKKIRERRNQ